MMDRGYQHNLKEELQSEINETHRNRIPRSWNKTVEKEMLPFETQYQPLVSKKKKSPGGGRGGYSREFWIGVCRGGSWTLTLFKD